MGKLLSFKSGILLDKRDSRLSLPVIIKELMVLLLLMILLIEILLLRYLSG